MRAKRSATGPVAKPTVEKRALNVAQKKQPSRGAPFNEQDIKRRMGNFTGAGEHARRGGRTSGIVGQTKQKLHTDKHSDPKPK
jgi:hypothetical protein